MNMLLPVDFLLEKGARLEGEDLAGDDGEGFPGLGVAAGTIPLQALISIQINYHSFNGCGKFRDVVAAYSEHGLGIKVEVVV